MFTLAPAIALARAGAILLLALVAGLNGGPVAAAEPSYRGRSLGAWLDDLASEHDAARNQAAEALREIGSAAVPRLLAELQPLPSPVLEAPNSTNPDWERRLRSFRVLRLIGQPACTPDSVAAVANLAVGADPHLARQALETLAGWGSSASNAIPQILNCFNAQLAAGGPSRSAALPPAPPYAWALARIGPDSKEVLLALLADATLGQPMLRQWSENSESGIKLVCEAARDPAVPMLSRKRAIGFLGSRRDTNLLAVLPKMLDEPELRVSLLGYVDRQGTNAASAWPMLLETAARFARDDPKFADSAFQVVERCGGSAPDTLVPILLALTFDERFPINSAIPANEPIPLCIFARSALEGVLGNRDRQLAVLTGYLRHQDWRLRNAAAARLWGMTPFGPETVARLAACLLDTNEIVQLSAAVTLAHRPEFRSSVLDRLLAAIRSHTMPPDLRVHALYQLAQRHPAGAEIAEATPVVQSAREDPDSRIQRAASRVLVSITPPGG